MDTATVAGHVFGAGGVTLRNAKVQLVNLDHNTRTSGSTNTAGFYVFLDVRPGRYRIEVYSPGFRSVTLNNLTLYTQDEIQRNFTLTPGSPVESITLDANGTPIQMSAAVGTVVDHTLVTSLPLNGRSFQMLFELTPGVVITPSSPTSQGQFSVNGQRTNANYFIIDGVSANFGIAASVNPGQSAGGSLPAVTAFGGTNSLVSVDDVQEFALVTSSYSPEFGRVPGGQVSILTRTGTNEIHGSAFDYLRNSALDANDWFANKEGLPRAPLRQNDFGMVLGGPIDRNRTFFFASYEGLRLRQPTSRLIDVPSLTARNSAPPSIMSFLDAYPLPNGLDEGNGLARATYGFSDPSGLDSESIRIDHHLNQKLKVFARYAYSTSDRQQRGAQANSLSTITATQFGLKTFTFGLSYFEHPNIIHDVRFNWSTFSAVRNEHLDNFGGAVPLSGSPIFPAGFDASNALFQFFPTSPPSNIGLAIGKDDKSTQDQVNILGNSSWQLHGHILQAGFDIRWLSPTADPPTYNQSTFFPNVSAVLASAPLFSAIAATVTVHSHFTNYSSYVQDTWRPNARMSLTYGGRWDWTPAPTILGNNGLRPFGLTGIDDLQKLSLSKRRGPLYKTTLANIGPRIGVAYQISKSPGFESVARAGFGTFFDLGNGPSGTASSAPSFPFTALKFLSNTPFPLSLTNAQPAPLSTTPPFSSIQAFPSLLKAPYSYHWNLSFEQTMGGNQSFSVGFLGSAGHRLLRTEEYVGGEAGVPSDFTNVFFTNTSGFSNYEALQVHFVRRSSNDLYVTASYTLAHSLDNVSTDSTFQGVPARFVDSRRDYGASDFDIRHTATAAIEYRPRFLQHSRGASDFISNWFLNAIVTVRSSPPVDVVLLRNIGFGEYPLRPDLVINAPLYVVDAGAPGGRRINYRALSVSTAPRQGSLGRNAFRGFPLSQLDLAVGRNFKIFHGFDVSVRAEAFNVLNHPNFASPSAQLGQVDSNGRLIIQEGFGVASTTLAQGLQLGPFGFSSLYQQGGARSLQLAFRAAF
ncbi:MAG TPA: carboxypeptidase-like regulatory domain-containing protein [Candidatus Angelobacter sp.]|nr:carboxypeptidase-like regulatory domain-containing protein [Candidatus Angelobacter sp.]